MLTGLKQLLYNRKLKRYSETNLHKIPNDHFSNIKSVGILFDAISEQDQKSVLRFQEKLKKSGKDVHVLGYFDQKEEPGPQMFSYFNSDAVGFAMTPSSDVAKQFTENPFDVFINLDFRMHAPTNYIGAASSALFKIGPACGNTIHYDLMIDLGEDYKVNEFISELQRVFNLIN